MRSIILRTTARLLLPLLMVFAAFLLVRGHNEPGGGFAAGLVAAAGWSLYAIAYNPAVARRALRVDERLLIGVGLLLALASGLIGLLARTSFLAGVWTYIEVPNWGHVEIGTPVLFDVGVFLAVLGVTLTIIFALAEEE